MVAKFTEKEVQTRTRQSTLHADGLGLGPSLVSVAVRLKL